MCLVGIVRSAADVPLSETVSNRPWSRRCLLMKRNEAHIATNDLSTKARRRSEKSKWQVTRAAGRFHKDDRNVHWLAQIIR